MGLRSLTEKKSWPEGWVKTNQQYLSEAERFQMVWRGPDGGRWRLWKRPGSWTLSSLSGKKWTIKGVVRPADSSPGDGKMERGMKAFTRCFRQRWMAPCHEGESAFVSRCFMCIFMRVLFKEGDAWQSMEISEFILGYCSRYKWPTLTFDLTFLARVREVQKCPISNPKCDIAGELEIMQVEAIKAISPAAADNVISFPPLWNALRAAITLNMVMQGRWLPALI